ncbi:MAG TPA: hypothetical protein VGK25_13130, partial [Ignavibacteria bacterium]
RKVRCNMPKIKRIFYINEEGKLINIQESPKNIYSYPEEVVDHDYRVFKELDSGEILPVNTVYYIDRYFDTVY